MHLLTGVSLGKAGSMQLDLRNEAEGIVNLTEGDPRLPAVQGRPGSAAPDAAEVWSRYPVKGIRRYGRGGMIKGSTMIDEGTKLAKCYRGPNGSPESDGDLSNFVKSTYR